MSLAKIKKLGKEMNDIDKSLKKLSTKRKKIEEEESKLKSERAIMETSQIGFMAKEGMTSLVIESGKKKITVTFNSKDIPTVTDKGKFNAYIIKSKAVDLLQARLNNAAILARWEDGVKVPGIGKFIKKTIKIKEK